LFERFGFGRPLGRRHYSPEGAITNSFGPAYSPEGRELQKIFSAICIPSRNGWEMLELFLWSAFCIGMGTHLRGSVLLSAVPARRFQDIIRIEEEAGWALLRT
jgi:hypothetical protein